LEYYFAITTDGNLLVPPGYDCLSPLSNPGIKPPISHNARLPSCRGNKNHTHNTKKKSLRCKVDLFVLLCSFDCVKALKSSFIPTGLIFIFCKLWQDHIIIFLQWKQKKTRSWQ